MEYTTIEVRHADRIAFVTMNRPDKRNALNDVMIKELSDAFAFLQRQNSLRVIILTGNGESFCSGMDLEYLQKYSILSHEENLDDARNFLKLVFLIHNNKKIVISMVNGPAMGGGCGLAIASDFVIVGETKATLGVPEVQRGFLPAIILLFLMKRLGESKAREVALTGSIFDANKAKDAGLVSKVVPDDQLLSVTSEFAESLVTSTSPSTITLTKELFARFDDMKRSEALDFAVALNALTRKTEDFKKGIESFLSKEKPKW